MRLGILIIGSLYWDRSPVRSRWRLSRLSCDGARGVKVPIRYGKKASTRGNTFTMVFAMSCLTDDQIGTGIVVPARAECYEPDQFIEEAEHLWAAERNREDISGICGTWGKVCILQNPHAIIPDPMLRAWQSRIDTLGKHYSPLHAAEGEQSVLEASTGRALFDWPTDPATKEPLADFDLLLMTANEPTLNERLQYHSPKEIADAWRADERDQVLYFHNNRHYGIRSFEDFAILSVLRGGR
jgi:hypothetical protein